MVIRLVQAAIKLRQELERWPLRIERPHLPPHTLPSQVRRWINRAEVDFDPLQEAGWLTMGGQKLRQFPYVLAYALPSEFESKLKGT